MLLFAIARGVLVSDQVPELLDAVRSLRCFDMRFGKNDAVAVPREIDPVPTGSDDLTKAS